MLLTVVVVLGEEEMHFAIEWHALTRTSLITISTSGMHFACYVFRFSG